jgi:hypothetical protein
MESFYAVFISRRGAENAEKRKPSVIEKSVLILILSALLEI